MKVITYMCENCFEPHIFNPDDNRTEYLCPKCGTKMMYFGTEEIDPLTNKVVNSYNEEDRQLNNPGQPVQSKPTVTCPYCQSTNTKKITNTSKAVHTAIFGIWSMGRNSKQWHCNDCGSDF